jgi:hypothetical protein
MGSASIGSADAGDVAFTMEMLELELSLDGGDPDVDDFSDRVRMAARDMKGALLFEMPASGLIDQCMRIAVLRIPRDTAPEGADQNATLGASETIFACLEPDGTSIRIEKPDERTIGLQNFAEAFVDVFQRI